MPSPIIDACDQALLLCKTLIEQGALICFPTETVYALACDAGNPDAVAKIYAVKGRNNYKPLSLLVSDIAMAERVALFPERAHDLATRFWPGPLTLVLEAKTGQFASAINQHGSTIGVRVPNHAFALKLLTLVDRPLVGTSANISGQESAISAQEITSQLGDQVSVIVDGGPSMLGQGSTVVRVVAEEITLLRPGPLDPLTP